MPTPSRGHGTRRDSLRPDRLGEGTGMDQAQQLDKEMAQLCIVAKSYTQLIVHHLNERGAGTAFLLRVDERLFAITVKHCTHHDNRILVQSGGLAEILNTIAHPDLDLAILELKSFEASAC